MKIEYETTMKIIIEKKQSRCWINQLNNLK